MKLKYNKHKKAFEDIKSIETFCELFNEIN